MQQCDYVVFGLGATGLSCVDYLQSQGYSFAVTDTRVNPPGLATLHEKYPEVSFIPPPWEINSFPKDARFLVSPGLELRQPIFQEAKIRGKLIGDVALFAEVATAPIVGITGSNGKSTVTTMVQHIAKDVRCPVAVGGNLGTPTLELLKEPSPKFFILELSSFQLDLCERLSLHCACNLNVTPDHLDRYDDFSAYQQSKHSIYHNAKHWVVNLDAPESMPMPIPADAVTFSINPETGARFTLKMREGVQYLCEGDQSLISVNELPFTQPHVLSNCLAALAIASTLGWPRDAAAHSLISYQSLPYRCHVMGRFVDRIWINDSKATNTGAVIAALTSLQSQYPNPLVILGGAPKNENYQVLATVLHAAQGVVLYGQAAEVIERDLVQAGLKIPKYRCTSLKEAVNLAYTFSKPNSAVILSPACTSLDQHRNYVHRGEEFAQLVQDLK
jgi:UDP-N-acetylmuramoylalanine--D-glutamate ligase